MFIIITTCIRVQTLGIESLTKLNGSQLIHHKDIVEDQNIFKLIFLPATLAVLNFYFIFIACQRFEDNKKLFISYLSLWFVQWATTAWHMKAFAARGIYPPIIDKWPLAVGVLVSTSIVAVFLSLHILRLIKETKKAKSMLQAHKLKSLLTEPHKVNSDSFRQYKTAGNREASNQCLTTKIEQNKHIKFVTELSNGIDTLINNPELDCRLLASKLCMSEKTMQRKIASALNMTPGVFIKISRMQRAEKMMTVEGITSRKELAYAVGFKNVSYFSKIFDEYLNP